MIMITEIWGGYSANISICGAECADICQCHCDSSFKVWDYKPSTILKLGICKRQHFAELPTKGYLIFWEIHLQIIKLFRLLNYWNSAGSKRDSRGSKWVNSTAIPLLSQRPNSIMCGCSIEASRNESCFHWTGCHSSDSFTTWILTTRIAGMDFHWWSSAGCCLRKV